MDGLSSDLCLRLMDGWMDGCWQMIPTLAQLQLPLYEVAPGDAPEDGDRDTQISLDGDTQRHLVVGYTDALEHLAGRALTQTCTEVLQFKCSLNVH
jgi:hypothetical protein